MTFTLGRRVGSNARNCSSALERTYGEPRNKMHVKLLKVVTYLILEEGLTLASMTQRIRPLASGGNKESL